MNIKEKIEVLRTQLHQFNHQYYVLNAPDISDKMFDDLMQELQELEKKHPEFADKNSPSMRVGSDINKNFKQVSHKYPMLSLSNTYSKSEVADFYNRIKKNLGDDFEICCEMKFDGTSISLTYEHGQLVRAVTRGDGSMGDDVTTNVKTIRSIPLQLRGTTYPDTFEIRGEILMPWNVFETLNKERELKEEALFANPRNAASGTLKQLNSAIVAQRKLDSYLYYLITDEKITDTHYENLLKAQEWGFKTSSITKRCVSLDEIYQFIDYWDIERKKLAVPTDGIVLKVNSLQQQEMLGLTAKSPRWAIAYKFQAEEALTRLNKVSYQVGRTGAVTPVANLDPVQLSGSVVRRASLHNADIIEQLDLHIGDMVYVEKGGEIIPKITRVKQNEDCFMRGEKVCFIKTCPECDTPLIRYEGESAFYCPNETNCPPQIKGKIEHFISRKAMNIDGLGPETVDLFYQKGLISTVADLYELKLKDIYSLERLGEKSAKRIIESTQGSIAVPFDRVLFALGIRFVGATVAKILVKYFGTIKKLQIATEEELVLVPEIGVRIAQSIVKFFSESSNKQLVSRLESFGLQFELSTENNIASSTILQGYSIIISGVFQQHSRDEYKELIIKNGGKIVSSISSKTTLMLGGENIGPSKYEKAKKFELKIINEDEFLKLLYEKQ